MRRAVLDVGSNSVLLVVAEKSGSSWVPLLETSAVTGLGTDVKTTGQIREDRKIATLKAIEDAFIASEKLQAKCKAYGTMALRIAENASAFLESAERQGTPVMVISGEQEAALGVEAVLCDPMFMNYPIVSVIDTGGHSTEVSTAKCSGAERTIKLKSVSVGALGLLETSLQSESPSASEQFAASKMIDDAIGDLGQLEDAGISVALGATPTNLVSIREGLVEWDVEKVHGKALTYEEVGRSVGWLCSMTLAERGSLVGIHKGREKTLHAGALILERFMNALHVDECLVSTRGWRHALFDREI